MHEPVGLGVAADVVGRIPAGHDHAVELRGRDFVVGLVAVDRISQLAGIGRSRRSADGDHVRARFAQPVERIPDFHFLINVIDQDNDLFSGELHSFL